MTTLMMKLMTTLMMKLMTTLMTTLMTILLMTILLMTTLTTKGIPASSSLPSPACDAIALTPGVYRSVAASVRARIWPGSVTPNACSGCLPPLRVCS